MQLERIGVVGYGEVGKTFAAGLKDKPGVRQSAAWDLKFAQPATARPSWRTRQAPASSRRPRCRRCARPATW
jgi:homoserine dehydrogenase